MDGRVVSSLPAGLSSNVANLVARIIEGEGIEGEGSIEQFVAHSHLKMAVPPICWLRSWWKLLRYFSGSTPDMYLFDCQDIFSFFTRFKNHID